jgi:hypothetical protein
LWLILMFHLLFANAEPINAEQVELFDTDQERVVQTIANTNEFQAEAKSILNSVTGRVLELNPSLEQAMIIKIPLAPPQKLTVPAAGIDETITQLFVIMPKREDRRPWLILHTKENDTLVLEFSGQVKKLKQLVHL